MNKEQVVEQISALMTKIGTIDQRVVDLIQYAELNLRSAFNHLGLLRDRLNGWQGKPTWKPMCMCGASNENTVTFLEECDGAAGEIAYGLMMLSAPIDYRKSL